MCAEHSGFGVGCRGCGRGVFNEAGRRQTVNHGAGTRQRFGVDAEEAARAFAGDPAGTRHHPERDGFLIKRGRDIADLERQGPAARDEAGVISQVSCRKSSPGCRAWRSQPITPLGRNNKIYPARTRHPDLEPRQQHRRAGDRRLAVAYLAPAGRGAGPDAIDPNGPDCALRRRFARRGGVGRGTQGDRLGVELPATLSYDNPRQSRVFARSGRMEQRGCARTPARVPRGARRSAMQPATMQSQSSAWRPLPGAANTAAWNLLQQAALMRSRRGLPAMRWTSRPCRPLPHARQMCGGSSRFVGIDQFDAAFRDFSTRSGAHRSAATDVLRGWHRKDETASAAALAGSRRRVSRRVPPTTQRCHRERA